jgi:ATP-dependent Clp protease, protease subunit
MQLEEDTDRDRYMSPLEAKSYGLIDHVIGGDDAGFKFTVRCCMTLLPQHAAAFQKCLQCTSPMLTSASAPSLRLQGSTTDFPKTKEDYVNWGDFADDDTRTKRFQGASKSLCN